MQLKGGEFLGLSDNQVMRRNEESIGELKAGGAQ